VTLFRWARKRDYLPDRTTAAEKLERPKVTRKVPPTYEPEEALKMLRAAPEEYLPWLLVQGWDGLRFEEVFPRKAKSGPQKRPFDWSDMLWSRNLIEVKAETAKTGERRVIPMDPMLRAILEPLAKKSGPIAEGLVPPSKKPKRGESLTTTLGKLVGGWKPNGLRNSFISNRAALVGLAKTAAEAGNSESEARKSYNDSKSEEEGKAWFAILGELLRTRFPRNRKPADLQRVS
jgi:integrase